MTPNAVSQPLNRSTPSAPAAEPPRGQAGRVSAGGARAGVRYRLDGLRRRPDVLLGRQNLQQMLVVHDHGGELAVLLFQE